MTDKLTTLLHDTASRVPTALHPAAELRQQAQQHQRERRVGAGAAVAALAAATVFFTSGVTGGADRAIQLPAEQPAVTEKSLLIVDELPVWGRFAWKVAETRNAEASNPAGSCQPGGAPISDLGAEETDIWTRSFISDGSLQLRQVAAEFASDEQARQAYEQVRGWYASCKPAFGAAQTWPLVRAAGGQFETVGKGSLGLVATNEEVGEFAFTSYGIVDDTVTIVTMALLGQDANFEKDPLASTMRFALHRLAGERAVTKNAIPVDFRFSEERTDGSWQKDPRDEMEFERNRSLAVPWQSTPCPDENEIGVRALPSDALRTGALTVTRLDADHDPAMRQLATYADAATARAVAEELRSEYVRCASTSDDFGGKTTWTTEQRSPDVTVHWSRIHTAEDADTPLTSAIAIANRGNAVFIATGGWEPGPAPNSPAVQAVDAAVEANLDLICEVADCE